MDMQERAAVALLYPEDRTIESVMVKNLTLPRQLGEMLLQHYTDRMKIWQMLQLGDMLSVGAELGQQVDLDRFDDDTYSEFYHMVNSQCVAIARDCRKSTKPGRPQAFDGVDQWEMAHIDYRRYLYDPRLKENGIWLYGEPGISERRPGNRPNTLMPLKWTTSRWKRRQRMARAAAARA